MSKIKIALPDLISNSYFPAVAAVELGCFKVHGIDAEIELIFPVDRCYHELKSGSVNFVAGSAHSAVAAFPNFDGVRLVCAQAQGMYWFLVMRPDLVKMRGALQELRDVKIGAAPWVDMGLHGLFESAGIDLGSRNIDIAPVPGAKPAPGQVVNFGVTAAKALGEGKIDGFWANGMGAEVAVTEGSGCILIDVRRGDGPSEAFNFTCASIAATEQTCVRDAGMVDACRHAITDVHRLLQQDVSRATAVAEKYFPAREASLIARLIERDLPYYDVGLSRAFVAGMSEFLARRGLITKRLSFADVVASPQWAP